MSSRQIAFFSLVVSSILWSSSGAVAKTLFPIIDPIPLAMLRLGVATAILLPLFFFHKHAPFFKTLVDVFPAAIGAAGNFLFFFLGVSRTTANAAAIIYTVVPLLTFFYARSAIQEYSTPQKLFGIIIGLFGVLLILLLPVLRHDQVLNGDLFGNIFLGCAVFFWTFYIVKSRGLSSKKHYEPLAITTISMSLSFLLFLLLTFFTPHRAITASVFTGTTILLLLYFGIGVTVVTFLLHQWAIKHSSAATAALATYLQPIFAFALNGIFLRERLTLEFLFGSLLVLLGTMLATGGNVLKALDYLRKK